MQPSRSVETVYFVFLFLFLAGIAPAPFQPALSAQRVDATGDRREPARIEAAERIEWSQWSGGRYRITPGDVIELTFVYVPEFNQSLTVQPDGYVSLRGVRDLHAQGRTVPEFQQELLEAYAAVLRDPVVSVVLKEFEKPYFVAAGEVAHPGKFDLRGATTVTQALAFAGGTTKSAKSSQVILFRHFSSDLLEVKQINVKKMYSSRDLSEDVVLRPGDTVFVPTSMISQLGAFLPRPSLGLYLDPFAMGR
jgi:polysaccharide export outer membrane protein